MAWNLSWSGVFLSSVSPKTGSLSTLHCCCCCPAIHTNPTGTSSTTTRYTHYLDLPSRTEINVRRETITANFARSMPLQCALDRAIAPTRLVTLAGNMKYIHGIDQSTTTMYKSGNNCTWPSPVVMNVP